MIFRPHVQPWHPSSTLTHEAALAVQRLAPEKFWDFSAALFQHQTEFFDVSVVNETRNKTYERLAKIAGSVGVDEKKALDLLQIPESAEPGNLNVGNKITNDLKWVIKVSLIPQDTLQLMFTNPRKTDRVIGVHVSPTVFFNVRAKNPLFAYPYRPHTDKPRREWRSAVSAVASLPNSGKSGWLRMWFEISSREVGPDCKANSSVRKRNIFFGIS